MIKLSVYRGVCIIQVLQIKRLGYLFMVTQQIRAEQVGCSALLTQSQGSLSTFYSHQISTK